jgi:hypothetical protein
MLLVVISSSLMAQAVVEAAGAAARATTTAVPADKTGKALNKAFDKITQTLQDTEKTQSLAPAATASPTGKAAPAAAPAKTMAAAAPTVAKSEVTYEDPSGIETGMEIAEITKRFGPPALQMASGSDEETLYYSKNGKNVDVTVRGGKATAVKKTGQ